MKAETIVRLELASKNLNEAWESNAEKMKYMDIEDEELKRLFTMNSKVEFARVQIENVIDLLQD